jgi:hypothetical protein
LTVDLSDRSFLVRHKQALSTTPAAVKFMFQGVPDKLTNPPYQVFKERNGLPAHHFNGLTRRKKPIQTLD